MKIWILFPLLVVPVFAKDAASPKTTPKPALSEKAKGRIKENMAAVDANIEDTKSNIASVQKNQKVLEEELRDLAKLEGEHEELKKKYSAYLASTEKELEVNEKALKDLQRFEQNQKGAPIAATDTVRKEQLATAQKERAEREAFRSDVKEKMAKAQRLIQDLNKNLNNIRSRREPIQAQIVIWKSREKEFENLLVELNEKKKALELLTKK